MVGQGLISLYPLEKMAIMGFFEIIQHLRFFKKVEKSVLNDVINNGYKAIILIDYPGFNLRIAKKIKNQTTVPIIYYITPQVWAWKESRIKHLKNYIDEIITIFPFEKKWFKERNINAHWVGHPYLENHMQISEQKAKKNLGINNKEICISLFPGSREQEVNRHLKLFINSAKTISKKLKNIRVLLHLADNIKIKETLPNNFLICRNQQKDVFCASRVAIIVSGTTSIEAATFVTPMIVVYKMNFFTWLLSKMLVKINFIAMPNIIAEKLVVPEFVQYKAKKKTIVKQAISILNDDIYSNECMESLRKIKHSLDKGNASMNAAEIIKSI